jgi:hypothetical protein
VKHLAADPMPTPARTALRSLLAHALVRKELDARPTPILLQSALIANTALLILNLLGSFISADGFRHTGFLPVGGNVVGGLIAFMQLLAWPALALAMIGLTLNALSRDQRAPAWVPATLAVQVVPTALIALGWLAVLALLALALAIWILVGALLVAFVGMIIAAALSD